MPAVFLPVTGVIGVGSGGVWKPYGYGQAGLGAYAESYHIGIGTYRGGDLYIAFPVFEG